MSQMRLSVSADRLPRLRVLRGADDDSVNGDEPAPTHQ